jgi:hypothetical protein
MVGPASVWWTVMVAPFDDVAANRARPMRDLCRVSGASADSFAAVRSTGWRFLNFGVVPRASRPGVVPVPPAYPCEVGKGAGGRPHVRPRRSCRLRPRSGPTDPTPAIPVPAPTHVTRGVRGRRSTSQAGGNAPAVRCPARARTRHRPGPRGGCPARARLTGAGSRTTAGRPTASAAGRPTTVPRRAGRGQPRQRYAGERVAARRTAGVVVAHVHCRSPGTNASAGIHHDYHAQRIISNE